MCKDCGCDKKSNHDHDHNHGHEHTHDHSNEPGGRIITLEQKILSENDRQADANRNWLSKHGVTALNLISSPGSGKTLLLEKTLEALKGRTKCAVIAGDLQTDNDARRLAGKGADVRQIQTVSACHLSAGQIRPLLPELADNGTKLLFIENVGNLVCPSAFDLGEAFKISILSVTEGEDKPLKYPSLFTLTPVVVISKMDLLPHLDCSIASIRENLRKVRPGVLIFEVSAKTGQGMTEWTAYLAQLVQ